MKLQLVYQRIKSMGCIPHHHYDLCTLEKSPKNVACILVEGKECVKIIRDMVKMHNAQDQKGTQLIVRKG